LAVRGDVRRGALASIQILVDQGVDTSTFDRRRVRSWRRRGRGRGGAGEVEGAGTSEVWRRRGGREMERRMSVTGAEPERREEQPKGVSVGDF